MNSTVQAVPAYVPKEGHWDEALVRPGVPRRHWRQLSVVLGRMGRDQLSRRWRAGQQLIRANGITYNVYGDPEGRERAWRMDPIPLTIGAGEWRSIEAAVIQRATLLNEILRDLYGSRRLLHEAHLPSALVFANPWFLRPCAGLQVPSGVYLHTYAVDLARSPGGDWWVITDRAQSPSGLGYTLENRLVSARTLPGAFSQCRVRNLNRFYDAQRDGLLALVPGGRENPSAVLLTPGPNNETYFEHSYLARHWGFPLVEGADLTVRGNEVYLKTLSGLARVDLILRRMDDTFCDPLELRADSLLGVPGLANAARAGKVVIANALGTGILETPAQMAFLPGLCRTLLGEELKAPSVATWWCGQDGPRKYVLDHLDELVLKPTFPGPGKHPVFPSNLSRFEKEELKRQIEAEPEKWVAQEQVKLSTAPVRTENGYAPRHIVMRVFCAWDGSGYTVLPGGLTRVSTEASSLVVSMQLGGGSKDTWVLTEPEDEHNHHAGTAGLPRRDEHVARRASEVTHAAMGTGNLPSRVADNLFWLGRYTERVEAGVRMVRALLPGLSGEEDYGRTASLDIATQLLTALGCMAEPDSEDHRPVHIGQRRREIQNILSRMVYDPTRASGIGWNLKHVRRVLWPLKERLSSDTWRVLQRLETEFSVPPPGNPESRLIAEMNLLDGVIMTLSAFAGLLQENTTRGPGWRFLEIGKRMERTLQTVELLDAALVQSPFEFEAYIETLLQIADSSITYRSRYFTSLRVEYVLELLVEDPANPRSVRFQLDSMREHIRALPHLSAHADDALADQMDEVVRRTAALSSEDLADRDAEGNLTILEAFLATLRTDLYALSDALSASYFSHLMVSRLEQSL